MAFLAGITVYPLKSFDGLPVEQSAVLPAGGLQYDRQWALFDAQQNFVNGKRAPLVHRLRIAVNPAARRLEDCGTGSSWDLDTQRQAVEAWFSAQFNQPVQLRENGDGGFPDDTQSPGPTVVSTATLQAVAEWFGLSLEETRRRFRANLEIGGVDPFWEDRLVGPPEVEVAFRVGPLKLAGTNPCQRCVVPSRHPHTGQVRPNFARQFAQRRQATLPSWAPSARFDHFYRLAVNTRRLDAGEATVRIGDAVELL